MQWIKAVALVLLLLGSSSSYAQPPWIKAQPSATRIKSDIQFDSSRFAITFKGDFSQAEQDKLLAWMKTVGTSMTTVYGKLPLETIIVEFIPILHTSQ